jgi:2'-hydroxyisoflavone reductase
MSSRRHFLQLLGGAGAGLGLGAAGFPGLLQAAPRPLAPARRALRLLILGGTGFLGPYLVKEAGARGHRVTIFTRGRREPGLFEEAYAGVEHLTGDRDLPDGHAVLGGRTWDAVIETSGYQHGWTRAAVRQLAGAVGRYLYVSSTGVFWPYHTVDIPEEGPVRRADDPPADPPSYGVMKARSEDEVRGAFADGAIVVRPGYIVGPGDPTDRWSYWPVRIARGGEILVPGRPEDPVQYIDVRDLTEWMIRLLEQGTTGTFNVVGPGRDQTMAEFVHGVAAITPVPLSWTWIDDHDWLRAYPLRTAADGRTSGLTWAIPWVLPEGDNRGALRIDGRRAIAAGLTFRPLATTAADTLAWRTSAAVPAPLRENPRFVLTAEQETAMLAAWKRRTGAATGAPG